MQFVLRILKTRLAILERKKIERLTSISSKIELITLTIEIVR